MQPPENVFDHFTQVTAHIHMYVFYKKAYVLKMFNVLAYNDKRYIRYLELSSLSHEIQRRLHVKAYVKDVQPPESVFVHLTQVNDHIHMYVFTKKTNLFFKDVQCVG